MRRAVILRLFVRLRPLSPANHRAVEVDDEDGVVANDVSLASRGQAHDISRTCLKLLALGGNDLDATGGVVEEMWRVSPFAHYQRLARVERTPARLKHQPVNDHATNGYPLQPSLLEGVDLVWPVEVLAFVTRRGMPPSLLRSKQRLCSN